jgi:polysaccharide biosynthesis protein PelA
MGAQSTAFHGHHRTFQAFEFRRWNFEHLFISLRQPVRPSTGRIPDICWTRLAGFVRQIMHPRPRLHLRTALAGLLLVVGALLPVVATAQTPGDEPRVEPVRREILAVYDSREEERPDQTRIHRFAEMPLNYLGFVVTYWDLSAGMPSAERSENLRGVITWFRRPPPPAFYLWAQQEVTRGARMVVLGDSGLPSGNTSLADANKLFAEIGFGLSGATVDITYGARVLQRDGLVGFERPLDPVLPAFPIVGTFGSDVTSHLVLEYHEGTQVLASSVVLTSSHGGYAANGYFVYEEPGTGRTKWIIDPFAFFQKAFGVEMMPVPDVTTISGRRIWFSHIDGDGWNNVSYIESYRDKPTIAAGVVLRELIAPYPDLPVAIGVIGADIDERYGGPEAARAVARELYALPQVEVATHTYTHPYQWSFFESYDRALEERINGPDESEWTAVVGDRMRRVARRLFPGFVRKNAETETKFIDDDPPRAYSEFPFDLDQEVRGAITAAEEMAPEGKRGTLYLWSGGAEPFEAAIARTRRIGLRNLNGGDSRIDADYPSISYLSPIARSVGAERQIYAADANDYIFITDGGGREHGFLNLDTTISATENPRRLKPIDVYYHMFAGERPAQLAGVKHHLDAGRQALVTPIAASHYAAIADGFFSTQITSLGESSWLIQNRGALQTLRFDDAAGLAVDLGRSVGVLGQRKKGNVLYVALDEAYAEPIVALGPDSGGNAGTPYLIDGRWTFRDLRRNECGGFTVMAKGYGTGQMAWGGVKPGVYRVSVRDPNETVWDDFAEVGDDGRLTLTADADANNPLEIEVACTKPGEKN